MHTHTPLFTPRWEQIHNIDWNCDDMIILVTIIYWTSLVGQNFSTLTTTPLEVSTVIGPIFIDEKIEA